MLLGDQLEGPSPVLRLGNGAKNCEDTIRTLLLLLRNPVFRLWLSLATTITKRRSP